MIKDFSTVFWGYLPPTKEPYKVHEKVNAFIGPSGHGKTTIWDGLRLMLGASHFESKRTFSFYVHKKSNWAVVRVAFHNLSVNGVRPFELARKFKDVVTACCRIYKNDQSSWSRDYYLFDGEFHDLKDLHFNTKAYSEVLLNVGEYLEVLEQCLGITKEFRNLMAMSPDTVREVVNSSPHTLFNLIFDLKGAKSYKKRYDDSKQRLYEQEVAIERAEEEMEQAQSRFEETKQKAQKFRLYQAKEKEVKETRVRLKKLEYFEFQETLRSVKAEMTEVERQGKVEADKVNELTVKIINKQKEIDQLEVEYKQLDDIEEQANQEITEQTTKKALKDREIENLARQISILKHIEPQNNEYLGQLKDILVKELDNTKLNYSQMRTELSQLELRISDLKKDLLPYKDEAKRFRQILEANQISFIMIADAISVRPEMRKWQEAIEAYIGNNRYRIIVEPNNYLFAKKLQQGAKYGARVSLPKAGNNLSPRKDITYPSIRSAINISYQEKVEGYLERLNHVYLVETVEEGHNLQAHGIESITIEGLLQDDDGAIHLKYHSLCCGKLAIEEEKKRTYEIIFNKDKAVKELKDSIHKLQNELREVEEAVTKQEQLAKLPEMEHAHYLLEDEVKKLSVLIEESMQKKAEAKMEKGAIRNNEHAATKENAIFTANKEQALQKAIELKKRYTDLQQKVGSVDTSVKQALEELKVLGLSKDDIAFISYDIQGSAFWDQQGNLFTSKEMNNKLNTIILEKEKLYDPSVNEEIIRLVEVKEGQVDILIQNLYRLKEDRNNLERTCDDLLSQFRGHIKEIMKDYIMAFESFADLLKASAKGKLVEITPDPETWEIHLYIGFDGKEPVAVDGPHLSSGQKASTSLMILLAALSDNKNGKISPIMFLDEPKARVDDDRGNEMGQLLQVTDIQYFITHQQGESLKSIDWIDHAFTCSACESGKEFANQLILKKRSRGNL
ncbi:MAG TPA: chromosome segregation protein SMC [Pseudobacteroides sp.]|uniref:chromosome segregation protein SMC n=1 Tax=Pseudobacteroides sp. TaxID=1968840 RepID=UPI002F952338